MTFEINPTFPSSNSEKLILFSLAFQSNTSCWFFGTVKPVHKSSCSEVTFIAGNLSNFDELENADLNISTIYLVSSRMINRSSDLKVERLVGITVGREPHVNVDIGIHDEGKTMVEAYIYEVEGGKRYVHSFHGSKESEILEQTLIYKSK